MELVRTLLDVLGCPGAVRNAEHALQARDAELQALESVLERLAIVDARPVTLPAA